MKSFSPSLGLGSLGILFLQHWSPNHLILPNRLGLSRGENPKELPGGGQLVGVGVLLGVVRVAWRVGDYQGFEEEKGGEMFE